MSKSLSGLSSAVSTGDIIEVVALLERRADPNSLDEEGETPLFEATASGYLDVVAALLLHAADPSIESHANMTAVDLASDLDTETLFRLFRGAESDPSVRLPTLSRLSEPIRHEVEMHLSFIENDASKHLGEIADLAKSSGTSSTSKVHVLPDEQILPPGVDGEPREKSAPETTDEVPLVVAVRDGDVTEVLRLLREGADPNVCDVMGEPPLFEATISGNMDMMAALFLYSADPTKRSDHGASASDFAACDNTRKWLSIFAGTHEMNEIMAFAKETLNEPVRELLCLHFENRYRETCDQKTWKAPKLWNDSSTVREPDSASQQEGFPAALSEVDEPYTNPSHEPQSQHVEKVVEDRITHESVGAHGVGDSADESVSKHDQLPPVQQGVNREQQIYPKADQQVEQDSTAESTHAGSACEPTVASLSQENLEHTKLCMFSDEAEATEAQVAYESEIDKTNSEQSRETLKYGSKGQGQKSANHERDANPKTQQTNATDDADLKHARQKSAGMIHGMSTESAPESSITAEQRRQALAREMPSFKLFNTPGESAEDGDVEQRRQRFTNRMTSGGPPSPAAAALVELFRTGKVQSPEARRNLATLDPETVRVTLTASLLYLRQRGFDVQIARRGESPLHV